ncbi:MAG: DUF4272 domain-containing protein [Woeseiaceae bacterium]
MNDELDDSFEEDWDTRSSREIRRRSLVLFGLVRMANGEDGHGIYQWLVDQDVESAIAPEEKRILTSAHLSDKDQINASWRVEALEVMLWALNELPDLSPLSGQCDSSRIQDVFALILSNTSDFLDKDEMRSEGEIYEQQEAIENHNWTIRDARIHGRPQPKDLDSGVVEEKHYALNWILFGEDWDEVLTDT